jgi:hypothetical protein
MKITVYFTPNFSKRYKKYQKKYQSLEADMQLFISNLENTFSTDLGGGIYKYRLLVKSKNKGKSGGFRIITLEILVSENDKDVTLITIYDKNDHATISKSKIMEILKEEGLL